MRKRIPIKIANTSKNSEAFKSRTWKFPLRMHEFFLLTGVWPRHRETVYAKDGKPLLDPSGRAIITYYPSAKNSCEVDFDIPEPVRVYETHDGYVIGLVFKYVVSAHIVRPAGPSIRALQPDGVTYRYELNCGTGKEAADRFGYIHRSGRGSAGHSSLASAKAQLAAVESVREMLPCNDEDMEAMALEF